MANVIFVEQYARHKILINHYQLNQAGAALSFKRDTSQDRTDYDVLRDNHRFLWSSDEEEDADDEKKDASTGDRNKEWEKRLAKKYYDQLFKEYAICDLSRFKEKKVAMRWRIEEEVVRGKGQFICGEKDCLKEERLRSWEVNFKYQENGEVKNALVKLRLCPQCSDKLNYHHKKKEVIAPEDKQRIQKKKSKKRRRESSSEEDETNTKETKKHAKSKRSEEDIEMRMKRIMDSILL
jgi:protein FRA10AC1